MRISIGAPAGRFVAVVLERARALSLWLSFSLLSLCGCSPSPSDILLPAGDIKPPSIVDAGQSGPDAFDILFDENVRPVEKSFAFEPAPSTATPRSEGALLTVSLQPAVGAGIPCSLSGEARDDSGNTTRFLFEFVGFNDHPAQLRINEIQTGKNSSTSNPHRDYIEFMVEKGGNIGGIQARWASSVKSMAYTFPPCEVAANSLIVLHCSPEGIPGEVNEVGQNLAASSGVDASDTGRDFWTAEGGIPDETGIILLSLREGEAPFDGVFFASSAKEGEIDSARISAALNELDSQGIWPCSSPARWEDAFLWKSSSARPLHRRLDADPGPERWYLGEAGSQSPGRAMPSPSRQKKTR